MDIQSFGNEWRLTYHFVWGPMRAKPCLTGPVAQRLQALIQEKAGGLAVELVTVRVLPDRIYLAAQAPPTLAPHRIVCQLKAYTSHVLRREFRELTTIPTLWTRAYLVVAGDHLSPEEVLRLYEAAQKPRRPRGRPPRKERDDAD
jgi:putative transposase